MVSKRTIKRKTVTLNGELEGMSFVFRSNPRMQHMRELTSGEFDRISQAIGELLIETHNFRNAEDEELPDVATVRSEAENPDRAIYHLVGQYDTEMTLAIAREMIVNIGAVDPN